MSSILNHVLLSLLLQNNFFFDDPPHLLSFVFPPVLYLNRRPRAISRLPSRSMAHPKTESYEVNDGRLGGGGGEVGSLSLCSILACI